MSNAHETAAVALEAAAVALRAVAAVESTFKVGVEIDTRKMSDLPVGLKFKDRDGDIYEVTGPGVYSWPSGATVTLDPTDYPPLTITDLPEHAPEPTPPPAPAAPKVYTLDDFSAGERVRAIGVSIWGSNCDGEVGTVRRIHRIDRAVVVKFDRTDGDKLYRPEHLVKIDDEVSAATDPNAPAPKTVRIAAGRTEVLAEQSYSKDGAFLCLAESGGAYSNATAAHLTKSQTRDLIATLQAVLDAPSVAPW